MQIEADNLDYQTLNQMIRESEDTDITIQNCLGQRYIGAGLSGKNLTIYGVPGNALGAYMDGASIQLYGNAQEATGDTMNAGEIYIHGLAGDATGYAMRGGEVYVQGDIGYRAGIHMKEYEDKVPVLVVGGKAGSFLGEYQAGGLIVVLNIGGDEEPPVGYFCGTGMHGGKIFLCCEHPPKDLPEQVCWKKAEAADLEVIKPYVQKFADAFQMDAEALLDRPFILLTPNSASPYKQLYTAV